MRAADAGTWRAWHLSYHGDREALVTQVVHPVAAAALAAGHAARFHFVHYTLGGPHVRLRLLVRTGRASRVTELVRCSANAFFAREPSTATLPPDEVRRRNCGIVASDPLGAGAEDLVYPDNAVLPAVVRFEMERYGGPALLGHSLDYFALSSAGALRFLALHGGEPVGRRTAHAFRLLARVAWGLASDGTDFVALAGYAARLFAGNPLAGLVAPAAAAFKQKRDVYVHLLRQELASVAYGGGGGAESLAHGARALAMEVASAGDEAARWRICAGQLHMTANRLSLRNPDEIYLSALLALAARELADSDPDSWRRTWDRPPPATPLRELVDAALPVLLGDGRSASLAAAT